MSELALGFIGIGKMGEPMALRLLDAGHPLSAFNRSAEKLATLRAAGAEVLPTPCEVATVADIVLLCVTDDVAVKQIVFGEHGIAFAQRDEAGLLVDCSSISPEATRGIARRLEQANGMRWVDAPVSGGVPGARDGTLTFMCGGAEEDFARARPVLEHLGGRLTHMGPIGSGQLTKLCNQIIVSSTLAVIAETMHFAARTGVDAARLPEALRGGFADSLPLQLYGPRMNAPGEAEPLGEIATMLKDVENALTQARTHGVAMPLCATVGELYRLVGARGYLHADLDHLVRLFDDRGGDA